MNANSPVRVLIDAAVAVSLVGDLVVVFIVDRGTSTAAVPPRKWRGRRLLT